MPTYEKTVRHLKEAIFNKLNNDPTLTGLLGGSHIYYRSPPKDAQYPCVIYAIITDADNVFDDDISSGQVTESLFRITIFSRSSKTEESDSIEARVKVLLHGQRNLDTSKVICYGCHRDTLLEPLRDPETLTWITPSRYRVTWGVK